MQLLVNRILFRSAGLVVYRLQQNEILIDHAGDDQNGTRACLVSDMYSRHFHLISKDKLLNVLDLGANGGGFPLSMHCHGFNFATLACGEMNPATLGRLHFNVSQNIPAVRVCLINAAVCQSDGKMTVYLGKGGTNENINQTGAALGKKATEVITRSFDSVINECFGGALIDVCKIDIEGAEYDVVFSGATELLKNVRLLLIEVHPHPDRRKEELLSALSRLGFQGGVASRKPIATAVCMSSRTRGLSSSLASLKILQMGNCR
jgi:FkbM family methyltransferase